MALARACTVLMLLVLCGAASMASADHESTLSQEVSGSLSTDSICTSPELEQGQGAPRRCKVAEDEENISRRALVEGEEPEDAAGASESAREEEETAAGAATPLDLLTSQKGLLDAFFSSMSMILATEIGDETFIIAALMAMKHSRTVVLAGALSALAVMTVLSTGLGMLVPSLLSRNATNDVAAALYTIFGLRLLFMAWKADPKESSTEEEMKEVEERLKEEETGKGSLRALRLFFGKFLTPVFLEAFFLTFLAEWGDRSQIATITLAAQKNALGVTVGATLGHVLCTSLAVIGGRLLALRISHRTVATVGGSLFLAFAAHSFFSPVPEAE